LMRSSCESSSAPAASARATLAHRPRQPASPSH
jgi:hypothetical protein